MALNFIVIPEYQRPQHCHLEAYTNRQTDKHVLCFCFLESTSSAHKSLLSELASANCGSWDESASPAHGPPSFLCHDQQQQPPNIKLVILIWQRNKRKGSWLSDSLSVRLIQAQPRTTYCPRMKGPLLGPPSGGAWQQGAHCRPFPYRAPLSAAFAPLSSMELACLPFPHNNISWSILVIALRRARAA